MVLSLVRLTFVIVSKEAFRLFHLLQQAGDAITAKQHLAPASLPFCLTG